MAMNTTRKYFNLHLLGLSSPACWLLLLFLLGLILVFSPVTDAVAAPDEAAAQSGPPMPNTYYYVDWANATRQGTLNKNFISTRCTETITVGGIPTGFWYAWAPVDGSYRNDEPYGPTDGLVFSEVPNPTNWYYTDYQAFNIGHPDVINNLLDWSQSDWISYSDWVSGTTGFHHNQGRGTIFFPATQDTYYMTMPDHDCADNDDGFPGSPTAWNDWFLTWKVARVYFDLYAPSTTHSLAGTSGDNGWYRSNVTVSLNATDPRPDAAPSAGVKQSYWLTSPYSGPITVMTQGTNTFTYYSIDNANNVESDKAVTIKIDSVAPEGSIANPPDGSVVGGILNLSGASSDATSGVSLVEISFNNGTTWTGASGTTSWSYTWNTTALADGTYNIRIRVSDEAGNTFTSPTGYYLTVDNADPTVTINNPSTGSYIRGTTTVTGTASAGTSGLSKVEISLDNGSSWQLATGTTGWSFTWDTTAHPDGNFTILARSSATNGRTSANAEATPIIDNTPPTLAFTKPVSGGILTGDEQLAGTASDGAGSGVCIVQISFDEGDTWTGVTGTTVWQRSWDTTAEPDGPVTLLARAFDCVNNEGDTVAVTATVDNAPPSVAITTPGEGDTVSGTIDIAGTAADNSGVADVEISFNGTDWISASGTDSWGYIWDTTMFPDGLISIYARATDNAGLTSMPVTVEVVIDNTPPTVDIETPNDGSTLSGSITVGGSATDNGSGVCKVELSFDGGASWVEATGTLEWTFNWGTSTATDGSVTVLARAVECQGNTGPADSITVTVDNNPPIIIIEQPANGDTMSGSIMVGGSAEDDGSGVCKVELSFDGGVTWVEASGTTEWTFNWDSSTATDGVVTIQARAVDCVGNVGEDTAVTITVDNAPAPVTILLPEEGVIVRQTVEVSGTAGDGLGNPVANVQLSFDGGTTWVDANGTDTWTFPWDTTTVNDGTVIIQARAVDIAGQIGPEDTQSVVVDNTPPDVTISTPSDGITLGGIVNLAGTADDHLLGSGIASVDLSFDEGVSWIAASGTNNWTATWDTSLLPNGSYPVQARAVDKAGNVGNTATITIHVDNTPPGVDIIEPASGQAVRRTITIRGTAQDEDEGAGIDFVQVSLDGGSTWLRASGKGSWELEWDSTTVPDGPYTIMARSIDTLGAESTPDTANILVDNTPPDVAFLDPTDGETVRGKYDVLCRADDGRIGSGVALIEISYDDGRTWNALDEPDECEVYGRDTREGRNGETPLMLRAADRVGNVGETRIVVNVDNSEPAQPPTTPTGEPPAPETGDPAISKSGSPSHAIVGEKVIWTMQITNPHSVTTRQATFNDPIPPMFTIVNVAVVGNASYVTSGNTVTIAVPPMQPGEQIQVVIETISNESAQPGEACNAVYRNNGQTPARAACIILLPATLPETGGPSPEQVRAYDFARIPETFWSQLILRIKAWFHALQLKLSIGLIPRRICCHRVR